MCKNFSRNWAIGLLFLFLYKIILKIIYYCFIIVFNTERDFKVIKLMYRCFYLCWRTMRNILTERKQRGGGGS